MYKNYLKVSVKNLFNHKLFSAINVLGLAVGMSSFLLIVLFIRHELSFDKFQPDADRVYRLSMNFDNGGNFWASNAFNLLPTLRENLDEIELGGRLRAVSVPVSYEDIAFNEAGFRLADPEIFQLFAFQWLQGDPQRALAQPFTVVLTAATAEKYFGSQNPMGKTLLVDNQAPITVTGVIADLPDNSHLSGELFTAMSTGMAAYGEQLMTGPFDYHTYVRLREGKNVEELQAAMTGLLDRIMTPAFQDRTAIFPVSLTDIYFNPLSNELPGTPGSLSIVYSFSAIAAGILLIACINFMNLSTARSSQRAKEVGMRKSIGAGRLQLVRQFLGESVFLSLVAAMIAVVLVELLLPWFGTFVGKDLAASLIADPLLLTTLFVLSVVIGIGAGSYPAFYLSTFDPARVLKGDVTRGTAGLLFRNVLVIAQFSIAITLIIATAVIYSQMRYARNIELGYSKDQVVILNGSVTQNLGTQWETMKQELLRHLDINQVSASSVAPGKNLAGGMNFFYDGAPEDGASINFMAVDFNFFELYDMGMLSGRTFDENRVTDRMRFPFGGQEPSVSWILNESAIRQLGWTPENALNRNLSWGQANGLTGPVIGVATDVHYESVRNAMRPLVYMVTGSLFGGQPGVMSLNDASIRISGSNVQDALAHIDATWEAFMPGYPLNRHFLDQNFELLYAAEEKQGVMLSYFSGLAVFIACLGLYGLAAFNAERRTKEIGIRKVMGSGVLRIVLLLTNEFSKLVLIANVIAWPVAWYAMEQWLANFAYRIDLTPLIFIGSGLIALCIAWVTVGGTAAKAASKKPVLALRYE